MPRLLLALIWITASLVWIQADALPRDGDEEGHVGAAELFVQQLAQGEASAFVQDAWMGDLGEYPPLYPAVVGGWWWLTGQGDPGHTAVRGVNLLSLLACAWALGALARRREGVPGSSPGPALKAETAAFAFVLCLPLANGVSRHFMPEAALMAAVALAVWAAVRAADHPTVLRAILLGIILGAGLLVKQTFVIYALLPIAVALGRPRLHWLLTAVAAAAIAGPWYLRHLPEQLAYGSASAGSESQASIAAHLAYYPLATLWAGWGPVLTCCALAALVYAAIKGARRDVLIGAAWLLGGLLLLVLVPKKYPRLLLPILPAAALWVGAAAARLPTPRLHLGLWLLPAGAWLAMASLRNVPPPVLVEDLDPGCTQVWLRPAHLGDLGISAVLEAAAQAPGGPVRVLNASSSSGRLDPPAIPCELQTSHPWTSHLGPALRRAGQEREVLEGGRGPAGLELSWWAQSSDAPEEAVVVDVPELGVVLALETGS